MQVAPNGTAASVKRGPSIESASSGTPLEQLDDALQAKINATAGLSKYLEAKKMFCGGEANCPPCVGECEATKKNWLRVSQCCNSESMLGKQGASKVCCKWKEYENRTIEDYRNLNVQAEGLEGDLTLEPYTTTTFNNLLNSTSEEAILQGFKFQARQEGWADTLVQKMTVQDVDAYESLGEYRKQLKSLGGFFKRKLKRETVEERLLKNYYERLETSLKERGLPLDISPSLQEAADKMKTAVTEAQLSGLPVPADMLGKYSSAASTAAQAAADEQIKDLGTEAEVQNLFQTTSDAFQSAEQRVSELSDTTLNLLKVQQTQLANMQIMISKQFGDGEIKVKALQEVDAKLVEVSDNLFKIGNKIGNDQQAINTSLQRMDEQSDQTAMSKLRRVYEDVSWETLPQSLETPSFDQLHLRFAALRVNPSAFENPATINETAVGGDILDLLAPKTVEDVEKVLVDLL